MLSWALPLTVTVLSYGLAGGLWKQASLGNGQFCILLVVAKTVLNWLTWAVFSRQPPRLNPFLKYALLGQIVNGIAWIFYFRALQSGPAAIVQTVTAAYTALAALLALVFLKERLVAVQLVGITMVIVAGMLLGYGGGPGETTALGGWFVASLITLLCWAVAVTVFKHAYHQEGANDYIFFLANWAGMLLMLLPYGLYAAEPWTGGDLKLAWLIVGLYALGDLTLFAAINRGPASIVSPLSGLYPIPTLAYSALVLKETVLDVQWAAIGMVLVAIVLVVPAPDNPILKLFKR